MEREKISIAVSGHRSLYNNSYDLIPSMPITGFLRDVVQELVLYISQVNITADPGVNLFLLERFVFNRYYGIYDVCIHFGWKEQCDKWNYYDKQKLNKLCGWLRKHGGRFNYAVPWECNSRMLMGTAFQNRNRIVVESSDIVLAIFDLRSTGNTAQVIKFAKRMSKPILYINPQTSVFCVSEYGSNTEVKLNELGKKLLDFK